MQKLRNPVPLFLDTTGALMDGGKIYVGEVAGDPETDQIDAFWDSALTIPATQPIRTIGGMIVNGTSPAAVFVDEDDFSVRVRDSDDNLVTYSSSNFDGLNFQPLDADLTAIAALTTAAYGRGLLTLDGADLVVTEEATQTLLAKTLTSPAINGGALNAASTVNDTGTIATNSVGFRGMPTTGQTQGATITLAATDNGKRVSNTTGGWAISSNATLALPIGFTCVLYNDSGSTQTVAITTDTLRLHGSATTGTRTVAIRGFCTLVKVNTTEWVATGDVT